MTSAQVTPFPGLRPFEAYENHLFFGRDGQSDEILRRLRRNRFLAVIGTSGTGKSSLIRAGLLPLLYGGFMTQAGSRWRVAIFRPGSDPIGNLALALHAQDVLGHGNDGDIPHVLITETTLRRSALGLINVFRQARIPAQENLLVVVDQFEELFRFKQSAKGEQPEDEAAAFVKLLLEAARQNELPIYVAITMRSDFLGDCAQFQDLPEAINEGLYLIPRMTRDQRREAITGPVAVGGAKIAPRLLNRLLNDVGNNPDQLPTLQHALMRTWDYWAHHHEEDEPIDFRHYEAIGCMAEALSRHADEAYFALPSDHHRILAERLFKSLTEKGLDNREIRRPTRLRDLCAVTEADEAAVTAVIESFRHPGRSFLMPPTGAALGTDSLIDISHESLIRGWQRLTDWVEDEARSASIYRRVAETAVLHKEGKAGLWRDPDLQLALGWREQAKPTAAWAKRYSHHFDLAISFLDASMAHQQEEERRAEAARQRELRQARRLVTVLLLGLLVVISLALWAIDAQRRAAKSNSESVEIFRQALSVMDDFLSQLNDKKAKDVPSFQPVREALVETALKYYEQLVVQHGRNPSVREWAWNSLGLAYYTQGKLNQAIAHYNKQLEFTPNHKDAWNNLGDAYMALGKPEEAALAYNKQLKVVPQISGPSRVNAQQGKPRLVPVSISTQPSKFQVYRDGQLVGTTPWESKEEAVGSIIKVILKREGFKEQEITFRVQEHGNSYVYTPEKSSR